MVSAGSDKTSDFFLPDATASSFHNSISSLNPNHISNGLEGLWGAKTWHYSCIIPICWHVCRFFIFCHRCVDVVATEFDWLLISYLFWASLNTRRSLEVSNIPKFTERKHVLKIKMQFLTSSDPLRGSWHRTLTSMCVAVMVAATITANTATAAASLGDFDNLQSDQLDLGAAILQHLLSCGQHLILDNDITSRENKPHFITMFFPTDRSARMGAHL